MKTGRGRSGKKKKRRLRKDSKRMRSTVWSSSTHRNLITRQVLLKKIIINSYNLNNSWSRQQLIRMDSLSAQINWKKPKHKQLTNLNSLKRIDFSKMILKELASWLNYYDELESMMRKSSKNNKSSRLQLHHLSFKILAVLDLISKKFRLQKGKAVSIRVYWSLQGQT
jgi:hypothetical protein